MPARRSESYSPETGRRSSRIRGMSPRRRSPERRPIESPVMEESEGMFLAFLFFSFLFFFGGVDVICRFETWVDGADGGG